jgi:hypothetical protein
VGNHGKTLLAEDFYLGGSSWDCLRIYGDLKGFKFQPSKWKFDW